jgi:hypothetical protein
VEVTLDIFSGRPNPSWTLRPEDEKELARRLAGLLPASELPGSDDLGYRGFVVSNRAGEGGLPAEVRVFKGLVATKGEAGVSAFHDTHGLEQWLVEQARQHGLEGLLATVPGI